MKERPILFSAAMVNAILSGRKTQTRRIIKQQPDHRHRNITLDRYVLKEYLKESGLWQLVKETKCPYGKPQDQLWVRETWRKQDYSYFDPDKNFSEYQYKAGWPDEHVNNVKWKPSIHMPRIASRIDLLIKDIRVERLQDISEEDAKAEGLLYHELFEKWGYKESIGKWRGYKSPVDAFKYLWTSINGPESWDVNPWVWVVDFERIQPDSKQEAA